MHVAALSVNEQALLMTCKGSSASFVHERLAQHLRLPRSKKNARVDGVAGTSTHEVSYGVRR